MMVISPDEGGMSRAIYIANVLGLDMGMFYKRRIHDLRHSHVAHLIELGFSPVEIAERLGHESMAVTMTYSHLYPSKGRTMADRLGEDRDAHQKGA